MSKELEAARALVRMLEEKENTGKAPLSELKPGETFVTAFGEMIVLEQCGDTTKVISRGFVKENVVFDSDSPDFKKSNVEKILSSEVLEMYEKEFGSENIVEETTALTTVDMQEDFGTYTGKMRLLTFDEARKYNAIISKDKLNDWYWTMTPWSIKERGWEYAVAVVSSRGGIYGNDCGNNYGVRPVCILKSNIFVSKGE